MEHLEAEAASELSTGRQGSKFSPALETLGLTRGAYSPPRLGFHTSMRSGRWT